MKYYFLSGIPRAGNTILSSILNQNKDIGVSANSLVAETLYKLDEWKKSDVAFNNFPDEKLCPYYDSMIDNSDGIDIQILGIGTNGHIAFNEPGTPRDSVTRIVDLTENTIKDNSRFFNSIDEVPTQARTMGIDTIMKSKEIYLVAQGQHKKEILEKAMYGDVTPEIPASFLQEHQNLKVYYSDW